MGNFRMDNNMMLPRVAATITDNKTEEVLLFIWNTKMRVLYHLNIRFLALK